MLLGLTLGSAGSVSANVGPTVDLTAYARARAADGDGRTQIAVAGYDKALLQAPESVTVARRAYREALEAGDDALIDRSLAVLQKNGEAPPDAALLSLATAIRKNDLPAQNAALERIGKGPFEFAQASLRAWVAFGAGGDALTALDPAKGKAVARRFNAENRALLLIASGRIDEGVIALQALLGTDQASLDLRVNAAQLLAGEGRGELAQALLRGDDRVIVAFRSRLGNGVKPSAAFGLSRLLLRLAADLAEGDPTPISIALIRAALRVEPDNDRAKLLLADALSRNDASEGALLALQAIGPDSPFHAVALDARITVLNRAGDSARALLAATALSAAPGADSEDATRLGGLFLTARRYNDAAKAFTLSIKRVGNDVTWAHYLQLGSALDQAKRWPEARKALEKAVALAPDEPLALNYLAYARIERGEKVAESRAMLERASSLAPDDASVTDSLAWAYFRTGDAPRALPLLERAARAEPANGDIAEHLGDAYWAVGRRYEARYSWRAAAIVANPGDTARLAAKIASGPIEGARRP
ncbi:tetratricopeptide repeat protein [Sphingomonas sp.]|uniref:tetratricopeptide repeat protein n=1 Tax=Sphingomonas sp. TaxID=28214 RepID=UPI003D6D2BE5